MTVPGEKIEIPDETIDELFPLARDAFRSKVWDGLSFTAGMRAAIAVLWERHEQLMRKERTHYRRASEVEGSPAGPAPAERPPDIG